MKVGFARIGQLMYMQESPENFILNETEIFFRQLVNSRPKWKWHIVTPSTGSTDLKNVTQHGEQGLNPDMVDDKIEALVCFVTFAWLMSQRIPKLNGDGLCSPLMQAKRSFGQVTRLINTLGDSSDGKAPVVWVTTDGRSIPTRARDLKWPVGEVLTQYDGLETHKMFRYGDVRTPESLGFNDVEGTPEGHWTEQYRLRAVESELIMLGAEREPMVLDRPKKKGVLGMHRGERHSLLTDFGVGTSDPTWELRGKWPNIDDPVQPARRAHEQWRSTFIIPPDRGNPWPSAKPWEAYAAGTPVLVHPEYDKQGHIPLYDPEWQTVRDAADLKQKSDLLMSDDGMFERIATWQRETFDRHIEHNMCVNATLESLERPR